MTVEAAGNMQPFRVPSPRPLGWEVTSCGDGMVGFGAGEPVLDPYVTKDMLPGAVTVPWDVVVTDTLAVLPESEKPAANQVVGAVAVTSEMSGNVHVSTGPRARKGAGNRLAKLVRNVAADAYVAARLNSSNLPIEAGPANEDEILTLRRWIAEVYQRSGSIQDSDLGADGTLNETMDPYYPDRSSYFAARDIKTGRLLMGARLILAENGNVDTLQTHVNELSPEQQERLRRLGGTVAEFASFVKDPSISLPQSRLASPVLIREMVAGSLEKGIKHWLFGLNPKVAPTYERVFGPSMSNLGESVKLGKFAKGSFKPFSVDLVKGLEHISNGFGTVAAFTLRRFFGSVKAPSASVYVEDRSTTLIVPEVATQPVVPPLHVI